MDNVRATREAIVKKISLYDKHPHRTIESHPRRATQGPAAYRTLEPSLDKQPTRKKITINEYHMKKDSTGLIVQPRNKVRSMGKWEGGRRASEPKRRSRGAEEASSVESLLSHNLQMIKFSVQRERERLISKQKYKRSEQVRSLMEQRKGSSLGQRKESTHRLKHQPTVSPHPVFKDVVLEEIMTDEGGSLEEVFHDVCGHFWSYLSDKESKLGVGGSQAVTAVLKEVRGHLGGRLQEAMRGLQRISSQVGQLSTKTVMMRGVLLQEQGLHNEAILYLCKAMQRTCSNLFQLQLPQRDSSSRHLLSLLGYLSLARAYHHTSNYLCAINTLNSCQEAMSSYITLVRNQKVEGQSHQPNRVKKKSWALGGTGEGEATTNKFKKHSHPHHNHSSIELEQSKKKLSTRLTATLHHHHQQSVVEMPQQDTLPALAQAPTHSAYTPYLTQLHLLLARLYLRTRRWQAAAASYKQCILYDSFKLEPQLELASLYLARAQASKALQWLEECLSYRDGQAGVEVSYIRYHKALVLYEVGRLQESQQTLLTISCKELTSQVNYYRALIGLRQIEQPGQQANSSIQSILMLLNGAIAAFTSKEYLVKSYFQILLILLLHKHDYYGAQYQVNRFRKIMPLGSTKQPAPDSLALSRISRMVAEEEESSEGGITRGNVANWRSQQYFSLLFRLVEGVICVLKMKMGRGLSLLKGVTLELQEEEEMVGRYGTFYYRAMSRLLLQFKFYAYYIVRDYELALKHANRLLTVSRPTDQQVPHTLMTINKCMLETMILMRQGKYNYAMSKLAEIESLLPGGHTPHSAHPHPQPTHSFMAESNYNQLKALCLIQLYCKLEEEREGEGKTQSLDEPNKEVLLTGEELLRQCLMGEKENSVLYYLIAAIHFQLEQWQSSLKYIREALQYSDDHMIKHYFAKGNSKLMLQRYDEAIKDYTNAVIVYKEQPPPPTHPVDQEYYAETQTMIPGIYLNRAIAYLKQAYHLAQQHRNYPQNTTLIPNYKLKAAEDLHKYFSSLSAPNPPPHQLQQRLLLFLHTDDPSQLFEVAKAVPTLPPLPHDHTVSVYYLTKELNNCIHAMQAHPAPTPALRVDLLCLQALKKSSSPQQETIEQALMGLLELSEGVYKAKEAELQQLGDGRSGFTLEQMFGSACGSIFRWSDILFFIGVMHFQLGEYRTAVKYFEQSMNEKKTNNSLVSLWGYISQLTSREEEKEEECLYGELEGLLQNRIYSKEEIQYNIGVGYLMMQEYKQAYHYLQDYPNFLLLIKTALNRQKTHQQEEEEEEQERSRGGWEQEQDSVVDITPFPTHNRLCSIYPPTRIQQQKFHLSFCLPRISIPLLDLFSPQDLQPGTFSDDTLSNLSSRTTPRDHPRTEGGTRRGPMESVIGHIGLQDLQMKPMAPWIRHKGWGVVFTEEIVEQEVQLNSGRRRQEGKDEEKKRKKERYAEQDLK